MEPEVNKRRFCLLRAFDQHRHEVANEVRVDERADIDAQAVLVAHRAWRHVKVHVNLSEMFIFWRMRDFKPSECADDSENSRKNVRTLKDEF